MHVNEVNVQAQHIKWLISDYAKSTLLPTLNLLFQFRKKSLIDTVLNNVVTIIKQHYKPCSSNEWRYQYGSIEYMAYWICLIY